MGFFLLKKRHIYGKVPCTTVLKPNRHKFANIITEHAVHSLLLWTQNHLLPNQIPNATAVVVVPTGYGICLGSGRAKF